MPVQQIQKLQLRPLVMMMTLACFMLLFSIDIPRQHVAAFSFSITTKPKASCQQMQFGRPLCTPIPSALYATKDNKMDNEMDDGSKKENQGNADNSNILRGIAKKFFGQRDDEPENDKKVLDVPQSSSSIESPTNLVAGVFDTVDDLRKRVNAMRATEELEDIVRSMTTSSSSSSKSFMSPAEEDRRLTELRTLIKASRQKEERLQQACNQLSKERAMTKDNQKKAALLLAKQRVEEKLARVRYQGSLYERQRKLVLVASGKASKDTLGTTFSSSTSTIASSGGTFLPFFPVKDVDNMQLEEALEESNTNLVAGVFETVDELRKRVDAARTTEFLREIVRSGTLITAQEEKRRLNELKDRLNVSRKKQERLQQALKQLTKEKISTKEMNKKEALSIAARRVEEKIGRIKQQGDILEEQRKLVLMAAGKPPQESSNAFSSIAQFFRKGDDSKVSTIAKKERRTLKNIQSVPQALFSSQSENVTKWNDSSQNSTLSEGSGIASVFNNPFAGAQRFMSSMFNSQLEEWVVAFPKSRIDPGEIKPFRVAGLDLLVVASRDGKKIYCIANSCSHLGTPLETGALERRKTDRSTTEDDGCEDCIVCPLHKTAFALETGEVNGEWCPYPPILGTMMGAVKTKSSVAVFDIRTRGKNIEVKISSRLSLADSEEAVDKKKK